MIRLVMYHNGIEIDSVSCLKKYIRYNEYIKRLTDTLKSQHQQQLDASPFLPLFFIEGVPSKLNAWTHLPRSGRPKTGKVVRLKVVNHYNRGKKPPEIAKEAGISLRTVYAIIREEKKKRDIA